MRAIDVGSPALNERARLYDVERGLQALLAASCLVLAGCAAEEAMAEGDESLADDSGGMAPDEEGTTDEPLEEPGDEVATDQAPEESEPQEQPERGDWRV